MRHYYFYMFTYIQNMRHLLISKNVFALRFKAGGWVAI